MRIDSHYLQGALEELGHIGSRADQRGYYRLAWSPDERHAHSWFRDRLKALGLRVWTDGAGNSFGQWDIGEGPALAIGSHLDSVPSGGNYDGGLGVLSALAAIKALQDSGFRPTRPIRITAFTDEEGPRFGTGLLGSKAVAGLLDFDQCKNAHDDKGRSLAEAMAEYGFSIDNLPSVKATLPDFYGYLELHIEQGPRLENSGVDIGVVTDITGIAQILVTFFGVANHAGTTPKEDRHSALLAASRFILALEDFIAQEPQIVGNVGSIEVSPNAANVIPSQAKLRIDVRSPNEHALYRAVAWIREHAALRDPDATVSVYHQVSPAHMHTAWLPVIENAAEGLGFSHTRLVSWAGHDAGILAHVIPAAMLFVPSHRGISHAPEEWTAFDDVLQGAEVLAETAKQLAGMGEVHRP